MGGLFDSGDGDRDGGAESDSALGSDFDGTEGAVGEAGDKAEAGEGTELEAADGSVRGAHREEDEPGLDAAVEVTDTLIVLRAAGEPESAALTIAFNGIIVTGRGSDIDADDAVIAPAGDVISSGHISEGAVDTGSDGNEFGLHAIQAGILSGEGASGAGDGGVESGAFGGLFSGDGREGGFDFSVIAVKVLHQDTVAFMPEAELIIFGTVQEKNILSEAGGLTQGSHGGKVARENATGRKKFG